MSLTNSQIEAINQAMAATTPNDKLLSSSLILAAFPDSANKTIQWSDGTTSTL